MEVIVILNIQYHKAGELEQAFWTLKNVNNFKMLMLVYIHFLASKCPLTQIGMHYKSIQTAYLMSG